MKTVRPEKPNTALACEVEPLPPWHPAREVIRLTEVPMMLKKIYNLATSYQTVKGWALYGRDDKDGKKVYLQTFKMGRYRMVKKADLVAFLTTR